MINNLKNTFSLFWAKTVINKTFSSCIDIKKVSDDDTRYNDLDLDKSYLLYIHVPFCDNLCPFCTFHKYKHNFEESTRYFKSLRDEIKILKGKNIEVDSVYIGGGTPLTNEVELIKTIEFVKELFEVEDISCETDPNHIELETVKKLKGLVKRLSIGVQSFDDDILKQLHRYDRFGSGKDIEEKILKIKGILPITNIDLIFNLPNQDENILRSDISKAKALGVEQITTYPLMSSSLNEGFFKENKINTNEYKFYKIIKEMLKDYSMSNMWSFSNKEIALCDEYVSTHNEYIGVGSGAFSYINGKLCINSFDLEIYEFLIETKGDAFMAKSEFENINKVEYSLFNQLFQGSVDIDEFNKNFNVKIQELLAKELFLMCKFGVINIKNNVISPTKFGEYLLVSMMASFYSSMDKIRAMFRV